MNENEMNESLDNDSPAENTSGWSRELDRNDIDEFFSLRTCSH